MTSFQAPEEVLEAGDVDEPWKAIVYASQRIGCPRPIGYKRRSLMLKRIEEEMEIQRWSYRHLTAAVDYMKHRGIKARSFDYVFYHVEKARQNGFMPRRDTNNFDELHESVQQAVYLETDPTWQRKLLAARGTSLRKVYSMWEEQRLPELVP